jgi:hypothetical protein
MKGLDRMIRQQRLIVVTAGDRKSTPLENYREQFPRKGKIKTSRGSTQGTHLLERPNPATQSIGWRGLVGLAGLTPPDKSGSVSAGCALRWK